MTPDIRQASPMEAGVVSNVLLEAARWLQEIGQPLWKAGELLPDRLMADVKAGLFYLACVDGEAAGVFKMQDEDALFWPDVPVGESIFIHRVAVRRKFAGGQVTMAMVDYAKQTAAVKGKRFLRLDCASRPKLCRIYERQGFLKHSEKQVGPYLVTRYQFEITTANNRMEPTAFRSAAHA